MSKTHYVHGCDRGRNPHYYPGRTVSVTSEISEVDCKSCLKRIEKYDLKPRHLFPDVPTFEVIAKGCHVSREREKPGCNLVFQCPVCGTRNAHGGYYGEIGAADGHRVSHCRCWKDGYNLKEIASPENI